MKETLYSLHGNFAAWDLVNALKNAGDYAKLVGGALVTLLGIVLLIIFAVKLVQKLSGSQQGQQEGWFKLGAMLIIGGAMMLSGMGIIFTVASGGQKTIQDLGGNGMWMLQSLGLG